MADAVAAPVAPVATPAGKDAPAPVEAKTPAAAEVDDPEIELVLNGKPEKWKMSKAKARLQQELAAEQKFQKAAEIERRSRERDSRLKSDPWSVLREAGFDDAKIYELAAGRVNEEYQRQQLSPEQRELQAERARAEAAESKLQTHEETVKRQRLDAETKRHTAQYLQTFEQALGKAGIAVKAGDPNMSYAVSRLAQMEQMNAENGFGLSSDQLAETLGETFDQGIAIRTTGQEGEVLLKTLERAEPTLVKRINAALLARLEAKLAGQPGFKSRPAPTTKPRNGAGQFEPATEAPMSRDDWRKSLEEGL